RTSQTAHVPNGARPKRRGVPDAATARNSEPARTAQAEILRKRKDRAPAAAVRTKGRRRHEVAGARRFFGFAFFGRAVISVTPFSRARCFDGPRRFGSRAVWDVRRLGPAPLAVAPFGSRASPLYTLPTFS